MHSYGLLKSNFHPNAVASSIRELDRHRDNMLNAKIELSKNREQAFSLIRHLYSERFFLLFIRSKMEVN